MKTEVNSFSASWTRKLFSLLLNGAMENVLIGAQFSLKQAHMVPTYMLYHAVI